MYKYGPEAQHMVAEEMYQQCYRLIHACVGQPSINLMQQFTLLAKPIQSMLKSGVSVHMSMYDTVVSDFITFLKDWLQMHPFATVFGHAQSSKTKPTPAIHNVTIPTSPTSMYAPVSPPPTMAQVVQEGGQGMMGASLRHVTADQKRDFNQKNGYGPSKKQQQIAPTGKVRSWVAGAKFPMTALHYKTRIRYPLEGPVPPACTDSRCTMLGDWLDVLGHCTYCMHEAHQNQDCPTKAYHQWQRKHNPRSPKGPGSATPTKVHVHVQENSSAPAQ
jgi:hypothetical protein